MPLVMVIQADNEYRAFHAAKAIKNIQMKITQFRKNIYKLLLLGLVVILISSCQKDKGKYYDVQVKPTVYNGNVIQYLESQNGTYDSMLVVLKRYPDIIAKLTSGDSLTLFAIPNNSFQTALANFNNYRSSVDSPRLYLRPQPYNLSRLDSGMFNYEGLRVLISRYIINGNHSFNELAESSNGIPYTSYDYAYKMNLKAIQENSAGAVKDGPKVIEFSDMNYSIFRRFWKSAYTSSVATVQAGSVIVHTLSQNHEFGFSSFTSILSDFSIERAIWKPMSWHSIAPSSSFGGTVFHAFDGSLLTYWSSIYPGYTGYTEIPPPYYFTVDMGRTNSISGVAVQNRQETATSAAPGRTIAFQVEFADDTTVTKQPLVWRDPEIFYFPDPLPLTQYLKQKFVFSKLYQARFFRFTVLQNYGGINANKFVNLAELWLY